MDVTIENDDLRVMVADAGAELRSVFGRHNELEYMWSADPAYWGKTSPVLFPIVGTLKHGTYLSGGKSFALPRHGFARDRIFDLVDQGSDWASFELASDERTLAVYPFAFRLNITYRIQDNTLMVDYHVANEGVQKLYFSLGAHPAFAAPLVPGTRYEDHFLLFGAREQVQRWPITADGLIDRNPGTFLVQSNRVDLSRDLFASDAIVLKGLKSNVVSLRANSHPHGLDFHFDGFPFLGIWAAHGADFVCIEPWCGIADSVDHDNVLEHKEGIEEVASGSSWSRSWKAQFY